MNRFLHAQFNTQIRQIPSNMGLIFISLKSGFHAHTKPKMLYFNNLLFHRNPHLEMIGVDIPTPSRHQSRHYVVILQPAYLAKNPAKWRDSSIFGFLRLEPRQKQLKPPQRTASLLLSHLVNEIKRRQRSWSHRLTKPLLSRAYKVRLSVIIKKSS